MVADSCTDANKSFVAGIPDHLFNAARSRREFLIYLCQNRNALAAALACTHSWYIVESVDFGNFSTPIAEQIHKLDLGKSKTVIPEIQNLRWQKHDPADKNDEGSKPPDSAKLTDVFQQVLDGHLFTWISVAGEHAPLTLVLMRTASISHELIENLKMDPAPEPGLKSDLDWFSVHGAAVSSLLAGFTISQRPKLESFCQKSAMELRLRGERFRIRNDSITWSARPDIGDASPEQLHILDVATRLFEEQLLRRGFSDETDAFWQRHGADAFRRQLFFYVSVDKPILFVLPAFPFKNVNKETFVFGDLPDMAEKLAIDRLERFISSIRQIYAPGASLVLFSDGHVYNDLLSIPDTQVNQYKAAIMKMRSHNQFENQSDQFFIYISDFLEFYPGVDYASMRRRICNVFGASAAELRSQIATDRNTELLYAGFNRHFRNLGLRWLEYSNERQASGEERKLGARESRKLVAELSMAFLQRNSAYKGFIQCAFPDHVRLSIHPSMSSQKFGIVMVSSQDWSPPWNACAVKRTDGSWHLQRKAEAEKRPELVKMVSPDGLPYFVEQEAPEE